MTPLDRDRPLDLRNALVRRTIDRLPESALYARVYAAFHRAKSSRYSSIEAAAAVVARAEQAVIDAEQHYYDLVVLQKTPERVTVRDRRGTTFEALDLVTNSYNDLEWEAESREALARFVRDAPLSACISRKIAGLHAVHDELRNEVADFLGYPACVLGTCGYVSQLSTLFALFHRGDVIFSDEHNHASLVDGCRLSHATVVPYPHRDYAALEALLREHRGRYNGAGIVTDGVFSTKGSVADIDRVVELSRRYRCLSVVDDTHGVGVLGEGGRGVLDLFEARPDVVAGGFGKALGSFGGFAVASGPLATVIDLFGRQNVNTSFLSPLSAAQSLIQLRWYRQNLTTVQAERDARVLAFNAALGRHGLACYPAPGEHRHPIFCLYGESERATLEALKGLIAAGFLPSFFPPPVAPHPSLRFSVHRALPLAELERLADHLAGVPGLFVDSGGRRGVGQDAAHAAGPGRGRLRELAAHVPLVSRVVEWAS